MPPKFRFTVTNRADDKSDWTLAENTPDKFISNLVAMGHRIGAKDGTGIIGAVFKQGSRLEQVNLEEATAVILDVDGKFTKGSNPIPPKATLSEDGKYYHEVVPPDWFLSKIPYRGIAHSSHSYLPTLPKYRVILPLAEPVAPSEFLRLWFWLYDMVDRKADPACKNPDRMFFLPRCTPEAKEAGWPWVRQLYGPLLSLKDVPAEYQIPAEYAYALSRPKKKQGAHSAAPSTNFFPTDAFKLLDHILELPVFNWAVEEAEAVTREVWRGLATNIAAAVMDDDKAIEVGAQAFHTISACDDNRYNFSVTEKTFRDALKSARTYGPMTYATMKLNGLPDDVEEDLSHIPDDRRAKSPVAHARHALSHQERTQRPKDLAPASSLTIAGAELQTTEAPANSSGDPVSSGTPQDKAAATFSEATEETSVTSGTSGTLALEPDQVITNPADREPDDAELDAQLAAEAGQGGGEGSDKPLTISDMSQNDLMYDELRTAYICRRTHHFTGESYWDVDNPIKEQALDKRLMSFGLQRKQLDDWKVWIPVFQTKAPLYHETRLLVTAGKTTTFNTYRASTLQPFPGNWDHIRELFLHLVGGDPAALEYVLDWFALPLQKIRKRVNPALDTYKMGTALVFRGDPGAGKGTAMEIISLCYGLHNTLRLSQDDLDGKFNANLIDKLFIIGNEVISTSNRSPQTANKLKAWITEPQIPIEGKHVDGKEFDNNFNLVLTSNDERPVIVEKKDRRYSIFESGTVSKAIVDPIRADLITSQMEVRAFYDHLLQRPVKVRYGELFETAARKAVQAASASSSDSFADAVVADGFASVGAPWLEAAKNGETRELWVMHQDVPHILSDTLMSVYRSFCASRGSFAQHQRSLTQALRSAFPGVESDLRIRVGGVSRRAWKGIPLITKDSLSDAELDETLATPDPQLVLPANTETTDAAKPKSDNFET